jgi:glycosyltransferase involved in cell wall biosynthesis
LDAIGGITQVVVGLYDGIRRDGRLTPRILVASWEDLEPVEEVDAAGRSIVRSRVRGPLGRGSLFSTLAHYVLALPGELLRLRALVRRYSVEVVNCHYIGSSEFTWVLAKSLGVYRGKVILSLHGMDIRTVAKLQGLRRMLWRWALHHADRIVACSEGLAAETKAEFDLPEGKVVTIHNGVNFEQLDRMVAEAPDVGSRHGGPALINLATFEHKKGHDVLLRAFRKVIDRRPDAHLTIMGRGAESTQSTLHLVDELGLASCTTIRVDAPHPVALRALRDADMFVLSSRNEAFSVALLEAGAFGKPIVATDVCGVAELIQDGVTGLRVPSEDVDALATAILRLLEDQPAAADYGRRLRDRVHTKFTLDENSRNYLPLVGCPPR